MNANYQVQSSIKEILNDQPSEEQAWVYINNEEITLEIEKSQLKCLTEGYKASLNNNEIELTKENKRVLSIVLGDLLPLQINRFVAVDFRGELLVYSTYDGKIHYVNVRTKETKELEGHPVYTNFLKMFPSNEVILSAGLDRTIKLWSIKTNEMIRSFVHEAGTIEQVLMVGKGRNIISLSNSSANGFIQIWELGEPQLVKTLEFKNLQCMCLVTTKRKEVVTNPSLFECEDKLLLIGTKDTTYKLDLRNLKLTTWLESGSKFLGFEQPNVVARSEGEMAYVHILDSVDSHPNPNVLKFPNEGNQLINTLNPNLIYQQSTGSILLRSLNEEVKVLACEPSEIVVNKDEILTVSTDGSEIRRFKIT